MRVAELEITLPAVNTGVTQLLVFIGTSTRTVTVDVASVMTLGVTVTTASRIPN
jgi:hypothetical protein